MKKSALAFGREGTDRNSLPDFSAEWQLPGPKASNAEIKARFYYEFARESETILSLTEMLCHFSRGELRRARRRTIYYPGSWLRDLHPYSHSIVDALVPRINLRKIGWSQLEPEQRQNLIYAFSEREPAFRRLDKLELIEFAQEFLHPSEPDYEPSDFKPALRRHLADTSTQWHTGSHLYWNGMEDIAIRIDWSEGSQAIKAAMEKWFQGHKRRLLRLKREGKLPGREHGSYMYQLPDETGAKNPRPKYIAALRGLGAMRLSSHTLREAIEITKGVLYASDQRSRSAWKKGIMQARQTF